MIDRILGIIKENRLTNKQFCELLGFSLSTVTDWKNAKSKPTVNQIVKIAEHFDKSTDYIILGKTPNNYIKTGNIANGNNNHATVTISNGTTKTFELTDFEKELFRLYSILNIKNKNELLGFAYKLEQQQKDGQNGN